MNLVLYSSSFLVWWKIAKEVEKDQVITLDFKYTFQSLEMIPKVTAGTSATWPAPGRCSSCRAARSGASSRPSTAASAWRGTRGRRGTPRSCRPGVWTSGRCAAPGAWCRPAAETHDRSHKSSSHQHLSTISFCYQETVIKQTVAWGEDRDLEQLTQAVVQKFYGRKRDRFKGDDE